MSSNDSVLCLLINQCFPVQPAIQHFCYTDCHSGTLVTIDCHYLVVADRLYRPRSETGHMGVLNSGSSWQVQALQGPQAPLSLPRALLGRGTIAVPALPLPAPLLGLDTQHVCRCKIEIMRMWRSGGSWWWCGAQEARAPPLPWSCWTLRVLQLTPCTAAASAVLCANPWALRASWTTKRLWRMPTRWSSLLPFSALMCLQIVSRNAWTRRYKALWLGCQVDASRYLSYWTWKLALKPCPESNSVP